MNTKAIWVPVNGLHQFRQIALLPMMLLVTSCANIFSTGSSARSFNVRLDMPDARNGTSTTLPDGPVNVSSNATAAGQVPKIRIATAYRSMSNVYQVAAAWHTRAPRWTRSARAEISAGVIVGYGTSRGFVSAGPIWRLNGDGAPVIIEFGFSPTLLGGSTFGEHDLGGNFHFTSSLSAGRVFGQRRQYLAEMRIQHLSNGSLNSINPGLDSVGVSFSGAFGAR